MGIFSKIADAAKDIAHGAHGFAKGLLDGTTKGNSIGSLLGIVAGVGFAITGFISGGIIPALVLGVGLGAAAGVIGGSLIGGFFGAAKSGHEQMNLHQSAPAPQEKAVGTPVQSPAMPQVAMAPAVKAEPDVSFQSRLAVEREAKAQEASPGR